MVPPARPSPTNNLLVHARRELAKASEEPDVQEAILLRRQAAEKTWGHVAEVADLLIGITVGGPLAHKAREERLAFLDRAHGTSLLRQYDEIRTELHGRCFYDARCPVDVVRDGIGKAEEFLRTLEQVTRSRGGSR